MKKIITTLLIATVLFSCTKSVISDESEQGKEWYRVSAIGADTTSTAWMQARTETVGIVIAEDSKLKAELMNYTPAPGGKGIYTVKVTNKQNCQVIIRWNWEGLRIEGITPASDVIPANQVQTFTLTGEAKVGKIKLKAEGNCGNSSTLIIPITMNVLPIVFVESKTTRDAKGKVTVAFTIDDPSQINWFLIERIKGSEASQAALIAGDKVTKSFTIKL